MISFRPQQLSGVAHARIARGKSWRFFVPGILACLLGSIAGLTLRSFLGVSAWLPRVHVLICISENVARADSPITLQLYHRPQQR